MRLAFTELELLFGDRLTPRERASGGRPWLCSELIATPEARRKLVDWIERGGLAFATAATPSDVLVSLEFVGDEQLLLSAAQVIAELPPPVRDYVVAHATFLGVGLSLRGFCGARPGLGSRPFFIALASEEPPQFRELVAHECSHAWLLEEPDPSSVAAPALWMGAMHDLSFDRIPAHLRDAAAHERARSRRQEELAERLVRAWGFECKPADSAEEEGQEK